MDLLIKIVALAIAIAMGFFIGFFYRKYIIDSKLSSVEQKANLLLSNAKKEAQTIKKEALLEGKEEIQDLKTRVEEEAKKQRFELKRMEDRLLSREDSIEKKNRYLEKEEQIVNQKKEGLENKKEELASKNKILDEMLNKEILRLEAIAELTKEEAKAILIKRIEEEARYESAKEIRNIEAKLKEDADAMAKKIISQAIQRCEIGRAHV